MRLGAFFVHLLIPLPRIVPDTQLVLSKYVLNERTNLYPHPVFLLLIVAL